MRKGVHFNSSCIHIVNYVYTHSYNSGEMCYAQGMSVFPLPHFLIYLDPKLGWISWTREDMLFAKFLLLMAHRSPSLYSHNMYSIDIILAGGPQSSEKVNMLGVQYSEANLTNVRVFHIHNNYSSDILYIVLCDGPMFVSNGLCLHGHAMCDEGTCILSHYVCDGTVDCPDESDEVDCSHVCSSSDNYNININCFTSCSSPECVCNNLYFPCALGGCVPWSRVCDGVTDCPQGEDELQCGFSDMSNVTRALFLEHNFQDKVPLNSKAGDYKCINGSNISHVLVNDLIPDCPEQDDEETYYKFLKNGSRPDFFPDRVLCEESDATTCVKNYKGVCYPRHLHCIYETEYAQPAQYIRTCRNKAHLDSCEFYTCPSFFQMPFCLLHPCVCRV